MMRVGMKEFRKRVSEFADGGEPVTVVNRDRVVGTFVPAVGGAPKPTADFDALQADIDRWQIEFRETVPDWRERLRSVGIPESDIVEIEQLPA